MLFHPHTTTAYGVRFERFGKIGTITASKEIIISSGAVNSPKILMMSGIGPEEHLNELKVNCQEPKSFLYHHIIISAHKNLCIDNRFQFE